MQHNRLVSTLLLHSRPVVIPDPHNNLGRTCNVTGTGEGRWTVTRAVRFPGYSPTFYEVTRRSIDTSHPQYGYRDEWTYARLEDMGNLY